ncbi:hypothetical protein ACGFX8_17725 [Streptomyces sp. NPDC048362]|uniref:hypothetical protein n=1 Tax=Streptomyces sp. NPDC048362 TaxID=3365539 RepID=UPI00371791CA
MAATAAAAVSVSPTWASPPRGPEMPDCDTSGAGARLHTTEVVDLRAGLGARSRSLAVLAANTEFDAVCWGMTPDHLWWAYGQVASGRHAGFPHGRRGWVGGRSLAVGHRH